MNHRRVPAPSMHMRFQDACHPGCGSHLGGVSPLPCKKQPNVRVNLQRQGPLAVASALHNGKWKRALPLQILIRFRMFQERLCRPEPSKAVPRDLSADIAMALQCLRKLPKDRL